MLVLRGAGKCLVVSSSEPKRRERRGPVLSVRENILIWEDESVWLGAGFTGGLAGFYGSSAGSGKRSGKETVRADQGAGRPWRRPSAIEPGHDVRQRPRREPGYAQSGQMASKGGGAGTGSCPIAGGV